MILNECDILSCHHLGGGFVVEQGGVLRVNNCHIEDMNEAILIKPGGNLYLTDSDLKNNYKSIVFDDGPPSGFGNLFINGKNNIYGTGFLKKLFNGTSAESIGQFPLAGIYSKQNSVTPTSPITGLALFRTAHVIHSAYLPARRRKTPGMYGKYLLFQPGSGSSSAAALLPSSGWK